MRLMGIGNPGQEKAPALVEGDRYVDLSDLEAELGENYLSPTGLAATSDALAERVRSGSMHPLAGQRIGAPIARPHQILCIGLNYSDHAAETGQTVPDEPIIFHKSPNTLVGPNDDVQVPNGSVKTDWEVELGVVIGSTSTMVFAPAHIVWHFSQFRTLEPGDLINTGTPPGVGMGMIPPQYLHGGELITLGIDAPGGQSQRVVADPTQRPQG